MAPSRKGGLGLTFSGRGTFKTSQQKTDIHGIREVNAVLAQIAREDLNPAKGDLRQGTKKIATDTLIPALKMSAYASGVPIAPAMAGTIRTRTDRLVFVSVGAVNPKGLIGFKRGVGEGKSRARTRGNASTSSQSYRTTLAWGSELGPWPGGRALKKDGSTGRPVNHYGVARSKSHWVAVGANNRATWAAVKRDYDALLQRILRDYGEAR